MSQEPFTPTPPRQRSVRIRRGSGRATCSSAPDRAAGLSFADVVKTTIFLEDMADFGIVNEIYAEPLAPPYPARSTVAVRHLPAGARVEIDVIARARS